MIRQSLIAAGILSILAGCSPGNRVLPPNDDVVEPGVSISGTAVVGVAGGSGRSTRTVSGVKDLEISVGIPVGG